MRTWHVNLILSSLAVAGVAALAAPAVADPWKDKPGHGKGPKWADRGHERSNWDDDEHAHKGREKQGSLQAKDGGHGQTYWHKSKKHKHRIAAYKPGGGPPPWAPARGYRRKQAEGAWNPTTYVSPYPGYDPGSYFPPFGIGAGHCDRNTLGDTIGSAVGNAGSNLLQGQGADSQLASLAGLVVGAVVSDKISRRMDRIDRACVGQILEHAPDGRNIVWSQAGGPRYDVVPLTTYVTNAGNYCREYQTSTLIAGQVYRERGLACRQPTGAWKVA